MLCYLDKTFCASEVHQNDCNRQITPEQIAEAQKLGLPIAWGKFCSTRSVMSRPPAGFSDLPEEEKEAFYKKPIE